VEDVIVAMLFGVAGAVLCGGIHQGFEGPLCHPTLGIQTW